MTAVEVANLVRPGLHRVDDRLYLQIKRGRKLRRSWLHRYMLRGKQRWSGLGSARRVSLADARAARDHEQALIDQGIDPVAAKRAWQAYRRVAA
jgi:hypothetical protein